MVKHISRHTPKHPPGQSVYERYLRTEELLSLQTPEDESYATFVVYCSSSTCRPRYA